jgi:membrane protease YdiL (CAAX protease family)
MEQLNVVNFIFLVVLFVLTPRGALRSARMLRQAQAEGQPMPRTRMALSTAFALAILWFLSQINALSRGVNLFALPTLGVREIGLGVGALAILLLAIPLSRAIRSEAEERKRLLYGFAPRTGREYAIFAVIAVMAGVAEEAAYRGVAVWILTPIFGNILPAIFLSAMAFAVAHAVQGGKTMAIVLAIALVFHALVYFTGTLVIAMVVHTVYDLIAGAVAGKRALEIQAKDAARVEELGKPFEAPSAPPVALSL